MVVTFYSFKGGVGRSMALINVAEILATRGYRVIVADWDLEAPGLERYLLSHENGPEKYKTTLNEWLARDGIVDLLREYKLALTRPPLEEAPLPAGFTMLGKVPVRRPSSVAVPVPSSGRSADSLQLITAGRRDSEWQDKYGQIVRSFDWDDFYERWAGDAYMDFLRGDLAGDRRAGIAGAADLLLIDSRTGVTEQGGVCTHDLADLVVLFTAANDTNLEGTSWMAASLAQPALIQERGGRPLRLLPIPSRIEQVSQKEELVDFRSRFITALRKFIPVPASRVETFALDVEIPYMPFYSFYERVVAREPAARREQKLYTAYANIAEAIVQLGVEAELLDRRGPSDKLRSTRVIRPDPPHEPVLLTFDEAERAAAEALNNVLVAAGATVVSRLQPSSLPWALQFDDALATCAGMVAVSPVALSPLMKADISSARRHQAANARFRIVHAVAGEQTSPGASVPGVTTTIRLADVESNEFQYALIGALTAAPAAVQETASPYVGLRSFTEDDARFFFGRSHEAREFAGLVAESRATPANWIQIEGIAGVGKSSFVAAAIVPLLRRGLLTNSAKPPRLVSFRPGADPLPALAAAATTADTTDEVAQHRLLDALRSDSLALARLVERQRDDSPLLLVIDQFEELAGCPPAAVAQLTRLLTHVLDVPGLQFRLITVTRSEEVAHTLPTNRSPDIRFVLDGLDERRLTETITGPATVAGLQFEAGLVKRLVEATAELRSAPALISVLMQTMWSRRSGQLLTHEAYDSFAGGAAGLLVTHAARVLEGFATRPEGAQLRRLLLGLVTANRTRTSLTVEEALQLAGGSVPAARILAIATAGGMITRSHGDVALTHDLLLQPGSIVRSWLDAEVVGLKARDELEAAAAAWDAVGRPSTGLPGALLQRFGLAPSRSDRAREFLEAAAKVEAQTAEVSGSREAEERERAEQAHALAMSSRRRLRSARAASLILAAGIVMAVAYGVAAQRNAAQARAEAFAARARLELANQPATALTYALEAAQSGDSANVVAALQQALAVSREIARFEHKGEVLRAAFDRSGRRVLTVGSDGRAVVWEVAGAERTAPCTIQGEFVNGDLSPDGKYVAVVLRDGTARIYGTDNNCKASPIVLRDGMATIEDAFFSRDGSSLITAAGAYRTAALRTLNHGLVLPAQLSSSDPEQVSISLWQPDTGRVLQSIVTKPLDAAAFSENGRSLAVAIDRELTLWNLGSSRRLASTTWPGSSPAAIAQFSRDGRFLLVAGGTDAFVWQSDLSKSVHSVKAVESIRAAALDPTGSSLVMTQIAAFPPELVSLDRAQTRRRLTGHTGAVLEVGYSADGAYVATAGQDGTARVWDAKAEREPVVLRGHEAAVNVVEFSTDGARLLTVGLDNTARMWDLTPPQNFDKLSFADLVAEARKRQVLSQR